MKRECSEISIIKSEESKYYLTIESLLGNIKSEKICYVSFVRPFMEFINELKESEKDIDINKIHFIDTKTSQIIDIPPLYNCTFIKGVDFEKIDDALNIFTKKNLNGTIIFDNVSSLLFNASKSEIIKFTYEILNNYKNYECVYIYINDSQIKKEDNHELLKDLNLFSKKTINY